MVWNSHIEHCCRNSRWRLYSQLDRVGFDLKPVILLLLLGGLLFCPAIALPVQAAYVYCSSGLTSSTILKNVYGNVTCPVKSDKFNKFTLYGSNGTMAFDVSGPTALSQATYILTIQAYGNGTFDIRFIGEEPFRVIAPGSASSSYSIALGRQQVTYTSSQTTLLTIIYGNPKLSLAAGAWIAGLALVFLVVARTAYIFYEPTQEGRYSVILKNRKIFLSMCLVVFLIYLATLLFP